MFKRLKKTSTYKVSDRQNSVNQASTHALIPHRNDRLSDVERIEHEHPDAQVIACGHFRIAYISGDWLVITPRKARKSRRMGDKRIRLDLVSAVRYKSASSLKSGYIRFDQPGTPETHPRHNLNSEVYNENAIVFKKSQNPQFVALREYVESRMG